MNVFERYAPFIQDYIFRSGWQTLRGVQNAAGEAIFNTEENVLLTASTASGKTEAAFFPVLTLLDEDPSRTVGVLYIAPLKALINDQFGRLLELCEEQGIAVSRWHGDVPQTQKRKLLRKPSGSGDAAASADAQDIAAYEASEDVGSGEMLQIASLTY